MPVPVSIAYIDGANLHKGVGSMSWKLDYRRFRSWIRQKFGITEAHLFIGMMSKHADLYTYLQAAGYVLDFKEIIFDGNGKAKGRWGLTPTSQNPAISAGFSRLSGTKVKAAGQHS